MNEIYPFADLSTVLQDTDFASNGMMRRTGAGAYDIVTDNSAYWNTAYGWGDHASGGYLKANGSVPLTANWDVGNYIVTAKGLTIDDLLIQSGQDKLHDLSAMTVDAQDFLNVTKLDNTEVDTTGVGIAIGLSSGFIFRKDGTPGWLQLNSTHFASSILRAGVDADIYARFRIAASGMLNWGSGGAGFDTSLYRDAADRLKTDDTFETAVKFRVNGSDGISQSIDIVDSKGTTHFFGFNGGILTSYSTK